MEITARIYDAQNRLINTVKSKSNTQGLNYLIWKLDEQASNLPNAWITDESRGIPVLPGEYTIVLSSGEYQDTTSVRVIPDPRFDLVPEVDEQLYAYQKKVDLQVKTLADALKNIDKKQKALIKLEKQLKDLDHSTKSKLLAEIHAIKEELKMLKAQGQSPRPKRQLGAWQTKEITPYSKVRDVQQIAMSRVRGISEQDKDLLQEASQMVEVFQKAVEQFGTNEWASFLRKLKQAEVDWLSFLE